MGLYPRNLNWFVASMGIPRGPLSKVYLVDPVNGNDSNPGTNWRAPLLTVTAAEALCVADRHDTVLMLSGDTADNPTASITWDKDFTHLVGLSGNLPGVGQRCRIVGTAANDLNPVVTFAGKGNIIRNIQINNESDAAADSSAVILTGDRYYFENVFILGMVHATPAARAGANSFEMTGAHENMFLNCSVGVDTIVRAAANHELLMSGGSSKNMFRQCRFLSASSTAGKFMVGVETSVASGLNSFEECLFYNNSTNWGQELTNCFDIQGTQATYYIDLARSRLVGITGWADIVTHLYSADPAPNAGFGLSVNPTT